MIPIKYIKPMAYVLIVTFFASCSTTYEVTKRSELKLPEDLGTLTVYKNNGRIVRLNNFRLEDSTLVGDGKKINLSEIKKIESTEIHTGMTIFTIAIGAAVLTSFLVLLNKERDLNNEVRIIYPSGGMGCGLGSLNTDIRPLAGGQKDLINFGLIDFNKLNYVIVKGKTVSLYFKIKRIQDDEFEIEPSEEFPVQAGDLLPSSIELDIRTNQYK